MVSTAGPSRTMRPRRSSAFTANGSTVSSRVVWAGSRTGMSRSGLVITAAYRQLKAGLGGLLAAAIGVQAPGQNALLRMQPVLGLVEHHRVRAVDHLVGDLLATMGGQAVHEDRVRLGVSHQPR